MELEARVKIKCIPPILAAADNPKAISVVVREHFLFTNFEKTRQKKLQIIVAFPKKIKIYINSGIAVV